MAVKPKNAGVERPAIIERMLFEPILEVLPDDGLLSGDCYKDWDSDHGDRVRFYVSGYLEFLRKRAVKDTKQLFSKFSEEALKAAPEDWKGLLGREGVWDEVSANQFRAARNGEAMYAQKAALILLSAEFAVDAAIKNGKPVGGYKSGAEVYGDLKILPACYNIDDFNEKFLNGLSSEQIAEIAAAAGQPVTVLYDLTNWHTVTAQTAIKIKNAASQFGPVGQVRGKPGKRLGTKRASENEVLNLG